MRPLPSLPLPLPLPLPRPTGPRTWRRLHRMPARRALAAPAAAPPPASSWPVELAPAMRAALAGWGITTPTACQRAAIPAIASGHDCIVNAETGCGKTLAYLLPMVAAARADASRPPSLVLVPTAELAAQVGAVYNGLGSGLHAAVNTTRRPVQLQDNTRCIVSTPQALLNYDLRGFLLPACSTIALDEADMLLSGTHFKTVVRVLNAFRPAVTSHAPRKRLLRLGAEPICEWSPSLPPPPASQRAGVEGEALPQVVCVAATLPSRGFKSALSRLRGWFPDLVLVPSSGKHAVVDALEQEFCHVPDGEGKLEALVEHAGRHTRTLVFVNTAAAAYTPALSLRQAGLQVFELYGAKGEAERQDTLAAFAGAPGAAVLVATDIASRGLDIALDLVVQYDFADDATSYLHRVGRTARAGSRGKALHLIEGEGTPLAQQLEAAAGLEGASAPPLDHLFSRRRSLSKKARPGRRREGSDSGWGDEGHQAAPDTRQ